MDRRAAGERAEAIAAEHLEAHGLEIVLRNYRRRSGELDIVAREGEVLVIVEVRMRSDSRFGGAAASIDYAKRSRIVRTAQQLLQQRRDLRRLRVRFDVVLLGSLEDASSGPGPAPEWIRHAFEAT